MKIYINDEEYVFDCDFISLKDLLKKLDINKEGLVIELNDKYFPSTEIGDKEIKEGDRIGFIKMVGGG
jgi:thiamine biosynthesis protein ThiS